MRPHVLYWVKMHPATSPFSLFDSVICQFTSLVSVKNPDVEKKLDLMDVHGQR